MSKRFGNVIVSFFIVAKLFSCSSRTFSDDIDIRVRSTSKNAQYSHSLGEKSSPEWVNKNCSEDSTSHYFVGYGEGTSFLDSSRNALIDARINAVICIDGGTIEYSSEISESNKDAIIRSNSRTSLLVEGIDWSGLELIKDHKEKSASGKYAVYLLYKWSSIHVAKVRSEISAKEQLMRERCNEGEEKCLDRKLSSAKSEQSRVELMVSLCKDNVQEACARIDEIRLESNIGDQSKAFTSLSKGCQNGRVRSCNKIMSWIDGQRLSDLAGLSEAVTLEMKKICKNYSLKRACEIEDLRKECGLSSDEFYTGYMIRDTLDVLPACQSALRNRCYTGLEIECVSLYKHDRELARSKEKVICSEKSYGLCGLVPKPTLSGSRITGAMWDSCKPESFSGGICRSYLSERRFDTWSLATQDAVLSQLRPLACSLRGDGSLCIEAVVADVMSRINASNLKDILSEIMSTPVCLVGGCSDAEAFIRGAYGNVFAVVDENDVVSRHATEMLKSVLKEIGEASVRAVQSTNGLFGLNYLRAFFCSGIENSKSNECAQFKKNYPPTLGDVFHLNNRSTIVSLFNISSIGRQISFWPSINHTSTSEFMSYYRLPDFLTKRAHLLSSTPPALLTTRKLRSPNVSCRSDLDEDIIVTGGMVRGFRCFLRSRHESENWKRVSDEISLRSSRRIRVAKDGIAKRKEAIFDKDPFLKYVIEMGHGEFPDSFHRDGRYCVSTSDPYLLKSLPWSELANCPYAMTFEETKDGIALIVFDKEMFRLANDVPVFGKPVAD